MVTELREKSFEIRLKVLKNFKRISAHSQCFISNKVGLVYKKIKNQHRSLNLSELHNNVFQHTKNPTDTKNLENIPITPGSTETTEKTSTELNPVFIQFLL